MKKRIFTLILTLCCCSAFVSCGVIGEIANNLETPTPGASQVAEGEVTAESTSEPTAKPNSAEITFEEMTVVDNDQCTIKITGLKPNNLFGYALKVSLENKSAEKTYMFSVNGASVNDVEITPIYAEEVAPGKKANGEINLLDSSLPEGGIGDYTDIEISFRVYDSNDWLADEVAEETVHVYPYGQDKAATFVRQAQPTDNVVIDNENVTVTVLGFVDDDMWGYTVDFFLQNKTDKEVMFSAREASVNGYMVNPIYAVTVSGGNCAFNSMSFSETEFEENGITEVEVIEFILKAYDYNDPFADDLAEESITLNP